MNDKIMNKIPTEPLEEERWRNETKIIISNKDFISNDNNDLSAYSYKVEQYNEYRGNKLLSSYIESFFNVSGKDRLSGNGDGISLFNKYIDKESNLNDIVNDIDNFINALTSFKKGLVKGREKLIEANKTKVNKPDKF